MSSVKELANLIGSTSEILIKQIQDAGIINVSHPEDKISDRQKLQLLNYIRTNVKPKKQPPKEKISLKRSDSPAVFKNNKVTVEIRKKKDKKTPETNNISANTTKRVFISYSWDDETHIQWVKKFANRLRTDGINAILDRWELHPGDELTVFMERSINESDFVLIICTPNYAKKADLRKGGVGYEGSIITNDLYMTQNHRKYIPILKNGKWSASSPSYLSSKMYINMIDVDEQEEEGYRDLLLTLYERRETAPPIGKPLPN